MPKPDTDNSNQVTPNPALEKRSRRRFSSDYKLKIIQQADACKHGELGPLLRREKLYANQLAQWRREFSESGLAGLEKSAPGPSSSSTAEQRRIAQLERENIKLRKQLSVKEDCIELQKKVLHMIDQIDSEST
jgi:transposase